MIKATAKNYDLLNNFHSKGPVAYFLDVIESIIGDKFIADTAKAFDAFREIGDETTKCVSED